MKATELRTEIKEYILGELQTSLMRMGINAQLSLKVEKDYRKEDYLTVVSEPFQTTPVVFKKLWISGTFGCCESEEHKDKVLISVNLDYNWEAFSRGTNGTDLGTIWFSMSKELPEEIGKDEACYYIRKRHGLEL